MDRRQDHGRPGFSPQSESAAAMKLALFLYAVSAFAVAVHVGTMALVGMRLGVPVQEITLFYGTAWLRFRYRGVEYRVGWIPFGGVVRFQSRRARSVDPEKVLFAADMDPPGVNDLHPLERAFIAASGCLALIVLSASCLGPLAAVRSFGRGFAQLIPFAPWTPAWVPSGRDLVGRFLALLRSGPFRVALGVLAAKLTALNLLPLPPFNGGVIVLTLLGWKKGPPAKVEDFANQLGMWIALFLLGYWIFMTLGAR
jgi:membrane-associated protease RseP (regulator of RpoE activity)